MSTRITNDLLRSKMKDAIFGVAVGDAVGVPVEFVSHTFLMDHPVNEMLGYGSHNQPKGTWSDDTSMTLALVDALSETPAEICEAPDYSRIMDNFVGWLKEANFTATDIVFDCGGTCHEAIRNYRNGENPVNCGPDDEFSCGNGALMRIMPLLFWLERKYGREFLFNEEAREVIHNVTALTHGNKRCMVANGIYLSVADALMHMMLKEGIYAGEVVKNGLLKAFAVYSSLPEFADELEHFKRIFEDNFWLTPRSEIRSSGYVVDTLEAALWCLITTGNYKDCILKAINLGHDTDTVAAVAGGLAGLGYGIERIPFEWRKNLRKFDYIDELLEKFADSLR